MIEEMRKAELEVTELVNKKRDEWCDKYIYAPDVRMTCFQVVELLYKLGLIKDD